MKDERSHLIPGHGMWATTFAHLYCTQDQAITPHAAGRITTRTGKRYEIAVRCRTCGQEAVYTASQLPEGYSIYAIRVTGEDGPHLPVGLRPVPFLEESFEVVGCTLRFQGQRTIWYVNGKEHLDERF
jgi:hypothetical protein